MWDMEKTRVKGNNMGLFSNKSKKIIRSISFALGGYKFTSDGEYIRYQSAYGKSFRVPIRHIDSVSLDKGGAGKNIIKVIGRGSTLAEVELVKNWCEEAQEFILDEIDYYRDNHQI